MRVRVKVLAWKLWNIITTINKAATIRRSRLVGECNDKPKVPCGFLPEDVITPFSCSKN